MTLARVAVVVAVIAILATWSDLAVLRFDASAVEGKRVIVCGASTGIGENIALQYAALHARIVLVARRKDVLDRVAAQCVAAGAKEVHVLPTDLKSQLAVNTMMGNAINLLGGLDVLVLDHIVGYFDSWALESGRLSEDELVNMFQVNTLSYIHAATFALPYLAESHGSISVVSSAAAKMGMPRVAPYSASKHALRE